MGKIVKTTDFTGKYAVTQNAYSESTLQSFIDKYEKLYLYDLLGITLGDLFYADITTAFAQPVTVIYQTLFNSMFSDNNNSTICGQIRSNGIKEMLVGFIYFEYTKTQKIKNTLTGNVAQQNETSREANWNETEIYNIYNEAVKTYKSIQIYIDTVTDYPTYNGSRKSYNSWAI